MCVCPAQFFVHGHQHKSGVVTLQNAMFPDKYLRISEGKVTVVGTDLCGLAICTANI